MTRAFHASAIIAGGLSMSMFLACGDKDGEETGTTPEAEICDDGVDNDGDGETDCSDTDCEDDEDACPQGESECGDGEDNDGDGRIDCDDSDCDGTDECPEFFVPTFLSFEAQTGMLEGLQTEVTYTGKPLGSYFTVWMINDDWEGPDDEENHCAVFFDVSGATVDNTCEGCWDGAAWLVDTSLVVGFTGECENMDPDEWTDDPVAYLQTLSYGFGYGKLSGADAGYQDAIEKGFGSYWSEYSDNVFVNYIMTNLSGENEWFNGAYTFGYEIDSTGAIVGDGSTLITVGESDFAPDGYYVGNFFYGYGLEE